MQNKVRIPMKEISSEQVEKIEAEYGGGWFYLVKVVIQPCHGFKEVIDWWHVHREADTFTRRMVAHAPTKELAMEALEHLKGSQWKSFQSLNWNISIEDQLKCQEMEAELKKLKSQQDLEEAQRLAEEAEEKKKRAEARKKLREQKERVKLLKKVGDTDRFTGLEI